jgi:AhpD family alkylhydroperoxidase
MAAQKRIYGVRINARLMNNFLSHLGDIKRAKAQAAVSPEFEKRIMLAVTQVNGCRMCGYFHTREALKMGMDAAQIKSILDGQLGSAPEDEMIALVFAQHYADTIGRYDDAAWQRVVAAYGQDKAQAIRAYIRAIMVGNAQGNIVGALKSRFKGQPEPGSTFLREMTVLAADVFLIPFFLVKAAYIAVLKKIISIFKKESLRCCMNKTGRFF